MGSGPGAARTGVCLSLQPDGFEGVGHLRVDLERHPLSVTHLPEVNDPILDGDAAFPAAPDEANRDRDVIPSVHELLGQELKLLEHLRADVEGGEHSLAAAVDRRVGSLGPVPYLDLRIHDAEHHVEVAAVEGLVALAEDLDVFGVDRKTAQAGQLSFPAAAPGSRASSSASVASSSSV